MILAITGSSLLSLIIWIIILGVIFWLVQWAIGYIGLPEPFAKVCKVIIAIVVLVLLINVLLGLVDQSFIKW